MISFLGKYLETFLNWVDVSNKRIDEYNKITKLKSLVSPKSVTKDPEGQGKDPAKKG
jgi:hypothetical protein